MKWNSLSLRRTTVTCSRNLHVIFLGLRFSIILIYHLSGTKSLISALNSLHLRFSSVYGWSPLLPIETLNGSFPVHKFYIHPNVWNDTKNSSTNNSILLSNIVSFLFSNTLDHCQIPGTVFCISWCWTRGFTAVKIHTAAFWLWHHVDW